MTVVVLYTGGSAEIIKGVDHWVVDDRGALSIYAKPYGQETKLVATFAALNWIAVKEADRGKA